MKRLFIKVFFLLVAVGFIVFSCKKEYSCEGCINGNLPPIANAGPDQIITLPKDSVLLDGSASGDPDGTITSYKWVKIMGPGSAIIVKPDSSTSRVKALAMGVYQFELTVTDNGGLTAKDTVQVMVNAPGNQPPVACAGADQNITLPTNTVTLNGNCSVDPDNNITNYEWTKITNSTANIVTANGVQTQVTGLTQGIHQFELKVTDANGLSSKDTVQVKVNAAVVAYTCGDTNRPYIHARMIEVGRLSEIRTGMAVAAANDKILFAGGGYHYNNVFTKKVDIYNTTTNSWSTAELSHPRFDIAAVTAENKIFFVGGDDTDGSGPQSSVDVYDALTNNWSFMQLPRKDEGLAAAAVGNKVIFAGGFYYNNAVDIYDISSNTWSMSILPASMYAATAVTVGNKVYFVGGNCTTSFVYDNFTGSWSTFNGVKPRFFVAGINTGNKIYWAGGICDTVPDCRVEIQDVITNNITQHTLSAPGIFWKNGGQNAVVKDNKILFYSSSLVNNFKRIDKFDIYDISTNTWSIGVLPFTLESASIISVNNVVYLAGGLVNGVLSDKVWKLEF